MKIRAYDSADEISVIALWNECGLVVSQNDPAADIRQKLAVNRELFLVGVIDDALVASVMGGYDGHRGWINFLAVKPQYRQRSLGAEIMRAVETKLAALGCPKINLQIRSNNEAVVQFYRSLGYAIDDVISMGKRL